MFIYLVLYTGSDSVFLRGSYFLNAAGIVTAVAISLLPVRILRWSLSALLFFFLLSLIVVKFIRQGVSRVLLRAWE